MLASLTGDPTESARAAWVHAQQAALADAGAGPTTEDFTIERADLGDFSFMVIGDTGRGRSLAVLGRAGVPERVGEDSEFAVIASDVVYPDGDVNEYVGKFFMPVRGLPATDLRDAGQP